MICQEFEVPIKCSTECERETHWLPSNLSFLNYLLSSKACVLGLIKPNSNHGHTGYSFSKLNYLVREKRHFVLEIYRVSCSSSKFVPQICKSFCAPPNSIFVCSVWLEDGSVESVFDWYSSYLCGTRALYNAFSFILLKFNLKWKPVSQMLA